mmetsp:Transcript_27086/g.19528  ORF Transcript_27086/g.19528 Transcript_27086/m.19528 type:complete len:146 (+) Transcript_27086:157-594(+)
MTRLIGDLAHKANTDPSIKCIMWYGTERVFSTGIELRPFLTAEKITMDIVKPPIEDGYHMFKSLLYCEKPVVAVIRGPAIGNGITAISFADFVFVTPDVRFGAPFVGSFMSPEGSATVMFPTLMGQRKANEVLLLDKMISAKEAV